MCDDKGGGEEERVGVGGGGMLKGAVLRSLKC